MEVTKVGIAFAPQESQRRRNGSPAGRQDGASEQYQNVRPGRTREQIGEAHQPRQKPFGQWRPRRAGEKMRVLHLIGRIGALNRGNIVPPRQIELACPPRLARARRNRHIDRYDQTRSCACPDRCSVHAARHRMESRRIYDYRSLHRQPHRAAASHPGYRSLRAFLLVKRQRAVDDIREPRPHEAHARERSRDH